MNTQNEILNKLDLLIQESAELIRTHKHNPDEEVGFPTLSAGKFNDWKARCLEYISGLPGVSVELVHRFDHEVRGAYRSQVENGKCILKTIQDNIRNDFFQKHETKTV